MATISKVKTPRAIARTARWAEPGSKSAALFARSLRRKLMTSSLPKPVNAKSSDRALSCVRSCEQVLTPLATDTVKGEHERLGVFRIDVWEDYRHDHHAQPPAGQESMETTDDDEVLSPRDDGVDYPELLDPYCE